MAKALQKQFSACKQEFIEVFPILVSLILNRVMMLKNGRKGSVDFRFISILLGAFGFIPRFFCFSPVLALTSRKRHFNFGA